MNESRAHTVLLQPHTYEIVAFSVNFEHGQNNVQLELHLRKGDALVALKFLGVSDLEVEAGFPWLSTGLEILDESARGMENARVRVSSFEQNPAIRFWARDVERVST